MHAKAQLASLKGNISIARVLLESGADFYAESTDKGTALEYAQGISCSFYKQIQFKTINLER